MSDSHPSLRDVVTLLREDAEQCEKGGLQKRAHRYIVAASLLERVEAEVQTMPDAGRYNTRSDGEWGLVFDKARYASDMLEWSARLRAALASPGSSLHAGGARSE